MKRLWIFFLMVICLGQMMVAAGTTQAADWCQWNKNPDKIEPTYQPNNQRLILLNKSRAVVQVVEDHLILTDFYPVDYSPNCRYLVGALGKDGQFDTVIWDLESQPARRVSVFEKSYKYGHSVEWSPDSNYAVDGGREWDDLLTIADGSLIRLANEIVSDCDRHPSGCGGHLYGHNGLFWHPELNQLHITLTDGNVAVIDLSNGQPIDFRGPNFEVLPVEKATLLRERMASPYGCTPTVQYQLYNQQLILKSLTRGEVVDVIQSSLLLKQYRFLGWSPNCNYVAANIDEGKGLVTAIWDTRTNSRVAELSPTHKSRYAFDWSTWAP